MGRPKVSPFRILNKAGRAYLDFDTPDGGRELVALKLPFGDRKTCSREAREAGEREWRRLTEGRVVEEDRRVRTSKRLSELYAMFADRWVPPEDASVNERERLRKAYGVRMSYGQRMIGWASDEARRPDGSLRWRGDARTPLQRLVADDGPSSFLAWRLTSVKRKSMRKEKSNLVLFLEWTKAHGFLASLPPVSLPSGRGVTHPRMAKSGRGVHIALTLDHVARVVAAMPEWSNRTSRATGAAGAQAKRRFLVRPFFEMMWLTGLREATLERLEVPRNWRRGRTSLHLENADDKAQYGRDFPLTEASIAVLEKYAPASGHIFGHHDYRKHVRAAAKAALPPELAERFGGYHLRHFLGTHLANRAGTALPALQFVMGHTDLGTTSGYVHADAASARALLEQVAPDVAAARAKAASWAAKTAGPEPAEP